MWGRLVLRLEWLVMVREVGKRSGAVTYRHIRGRVCSDESQGMTRACKAITNGDEILRQKSLNFGQTRVLTKI